MGKESFYVNQIESQLDAIVREDANVNRSYMLALLTTLLSRKIFSLYRKKDRDGAINTCIDCIRFVLEEMEKE